MSPKISEHLDFLYGSGLNRGGDPLVRVLSEAVVASRNAMTRGPGSWSQGDALLIAYPDQVLDSGTTPLRALHQFARQHLAEVVSGIHLLPFYPSSSDDGFSVKDYTAVDPAFGSWDDVWAFASDFDLMFDAVFNHASAQGEWFRRSIAGDPAYADFFIEITGDPDLRQVVRPRTLPLLTEFLTQAGPRRYWTTFSADQVDLNCRNPRVLARLVETLLFYVRNGARFIRLDAVTFLWKELGTSCVHRPETHRIIQLFRSVLDEVAPEVVLITETNVPHDDNVSYFGDGTNEAQLVYNFALPGLILHAFTTGHAGQLTRWAQSLELPSDRVTFFNFLASHDGIGLNGVRGILTDGEIDALVRHVLASGGFVSFKRLSDGGESPYELNINLLDALAPSSTVTDTGEAARRFLTAHAAMLSLQGVPGLYFPSVLGLRGDPEAAMASGIPRRINRQKFRASALEAILGDADSLAARVSAGFRNLLGVRRSCAAFHPAGSQEVLDLDQRVFAVLRRSPDHAETVLCLQNLSSDPVVSFSPQSRDGILQQFDTATDLLTRRRVDFRPASAGAPVLQPWDSLWLRAGER
jgi:glycosidase